jgi:tetratricopeptide (TPR) repeat protein
MSLIRLGRQFLKWSLLDEAISELEFALQYDNKSGDAYEALGRAFLKRGSIKEAIELLQTGCKSISTLADLWQLLGRAFYRDGRLKESIGAHQRALKINRSYDEAHISLAICYLQILVEDIDEKIMTKIPCKGLENHASFTMGHLVSASALISKYLKGPYDISPEWEDLFRRKGPGDPRFPELDTSLNPAKNELLEKLAEQHKIVENLINDLEDDRFNEISKWRFDNYLPTLGDLLFFMCVTHESMHLGQLAAWRRAMGFDSALGKL